LVLRPIRQPISYPVVRTSVNAKRRKPPVDHSSQNGYAQVYVLIVADYFDFGLS
jgi:hypothetical protein